MKDLLKVSVLVALILVAACNRDRAAKNSEIANSTIFAPFKVEIPTELKGNTEAVEFIKVSEAAMNDYSKLVEKVYQECGSIIGKDAEQLTMSEKIKVMKVASEMAVGMAEYSVKYAEIAEKTVNFNENMTEDEIIAWAKVTETFEQRMKQIEEKYNKLNAFENM